MVDHATTRSNERYEMIAQILLHIRLTWEGKLLKLKSRNVRRSIDSRLFFCIEGSLRLLSRNVKSLIERFFISACESNFLPSLSTLAPSRENDLIEMRLPKNFATRATQSGVKEL